MKPTHKQMIYAGCLIMAYTCGILGAWLFSSGLKGHDVGMAIWGAFGCLIGFGYLKMAQRVRKSAPPAS